MSNSARSVFVFGVYLGVLGAEVDDSLDKMAIQPNTGAL